MCVMFKAGDMVLEYKILEPIGQGGFSQAYKAIGPDGKPVILKFPDAFLIGDPATYERFRREFAAGQKLNHPAIPRTIAMKEAPEGVFLVQEFVEGRSLRAFIAERAPMPVDEAVSIGVQLAGVIGYLHSNGVYHRDLKPENIIVDPDGHVHIIDFGSALMEGSRRVTWRYGSNAMGTPDYMAPEQIQGKRGDARTDVYALGMILYELLTGTVPFQGDNALSVMNQHLTATPESPRSIRLSIPPEVEAIVLKAIRRDPDERYQSAREMEHDLEHYKDLDLSGFRFGPEKAAGGLLTSRQILIRSGIVFLAFLAFTVLILLVVYIFRHR